MQVSFGKYQHALQHKKREWAKRVILQYSIATTKNSTFHKRWTENKKIRTPAELVFQNILDYLMVDYKREYPVFVGDHYYFLDFLICHPYRVAFEIDGGIHNQQESYDLRRDCEIMDRERIVIVRIKNEKVLFNTEETTHYVKRILSERMAQSKRTLSRQETHRQKERQKVSTQRRSKHINQLKKYLPNFKLNNP
jgi:very-short-patch-repair endonuclease